RGHVEAAVAARKGTGTECRVATPVSTRIRRKTGRRIERHIARGIRLNAIRGIAGAGPRSVCIPPAGKVVTAARRCCPSTVNRGGAGGAADADELGLGRREPKGGTRQAKARGQQQTCSDGRRTHSPGVLTLKVQLQISWYNERCQIAFCTASGCSDAN